MNVIERAQQLASESGSAAWLPADGVRTLMAESRRSIRELMLELVPLAGLSALPAISGFRVGVVTEGTSGALYFGANFEFATCPLNLTVHAEQAAVVNATNHGEAGLRRLALSTPPCGLCRQFLFELAGAADLEILLAGHEPTRLQDLLPHAFGPADLGVAGRRLSAEPQQLRWLDNSEHHGPLAAIALQAAGRAYAPYTQALAGAAFETVDGVRYAGSYLENAAFNPSLSALQSALVLASLSGKSAVQIAEVVIVQVEPSRIDHFGAEAQLLKKVAPGAAMRGILAARI